MNSPTSPAFALPEQSPFYPDDVSWQQPLLPTTLPAMLAETVALCGQKFALEFMGRRWRYASLAHAVERMAGALQKAGVSKGTRVGLCLPNTPHYVILFFAIMRCGGVVVNLNPLYAEQELEHHARDSGMEFVATLSNAQLYHKVAKLLALPAMKKIIVCDIAEMLPLFKGLAFRWLKRAEIAHVPQDTRHLRFKNLLGQNLCPQDVPLLPEDLAVLQYTGGTTGIAKAAMLSHANLTINCAQCRAWFPKVAIGAEKFLAVIPFFHVFAMTTIMNFGIKLGAEIVCLPKFDVKETVAAIDKHRPSIFPAVPSIYAGITIFKQLKKYNLRSIRFCISGGAGLPLEVKKRFEALTGCVLVEGYGLTESSPVACCNPVAGENRTGSIGLPLPGTYVEIVSLEDGTSIVAQGERGELCLRGPQLMRGYWQNDSETQQVLKAVNGEWRLHTGDIAYQDADGYTFIVDRLKDMILLGGYNIYPRQVEEAIYQHEAVAECVVVGVPDALRGQQVKAFIVLKAGASLTRDALLQFLQDKLAPHAQPRFVEFRESLPKTAVGKLSRKLMLEEELARSKAA